MSNARIYTDAAQLREALKAAEPADRRDLLLLKDNRALIVSNGAHLLAYSGEMKEIGTAIERLADVEIALVTRIEGPPEDRKEAGFGLFGGGRDDADAATSSQYHKPEFSEIWTDRNTIVRELSEELSPGDELGFLQDVESLRKTSLAARTDEWVNSWSPGQTENITFGAHSYYTLPVPQEKLDSLVEMSNPTSREVSRVGKHSLADALTRISRSDSTENLHYSREKASVWELAANLVQTTRTGGVIPKLSKIPSPEVAAQMMKELAADVQGKMGKADKLDFDRLAYDMGVTTAELSGQMGLEAGAIDKMQAAADKKFTQLQQGNVLAVG